MVNLLKKNIKMIEKVRSILKEGGDNYLKCALEKCDCQDDLYNLSIFGIKYPCIHTILHDFISGSFFQDFISIYQINLSEFFISCLKYLPYSLYLRSKFNQEIEKIASEINSEFILKYTFIDDKKILAELAKQFLACFTYSLPEFYDINLNQFSGNNFKKDKSNEKFYFPRHSPKAEFINIEKEKIDFWLSSTDSEWAKLIKKKFFLKLKMKLEQCIQN